MLHLLQRYRSYVLSLGGAVLLAGGFGMDAVSGEPFSLGWTQLFLIVTGFLCLAISPPPVQRTLSREIARSTRETPATLARLESRPWQLVGYGVWIAAALTAGEFALRIYEQSTGKRVQGEEYLWSVPLTHAVTIAAAGVLIAAIARWTNRRAAFAALIWVAAFVALAGWLAMSIRGLHAVAALTLAAGAGVQVARIAVRHAHLFDRIVRRSRTPLVVAIVIVAAIALVWPGVRESRALASLPVPSQNAPNVLFIVLDTVGAKSLGLYGYQKSTTPNLDKFAARGTIFDHALATAAWTLPSHGGMFTGRFPHELSSDWRTPIDGTHPMVAEAFAARGYQTAGFVANTQFCAAPFGLARGFAHYEDIRPSFGTVVRSTAFGRLFADMLPNSDPRKTQWYASSPGKVRFKNADEINRSALDWLGARRSDRPFFVFLNYFDAHAPYLAPTEFGKRFWPQRPRGDTWTKKLDEWTPEEVTELKAAYDGTLASLDHQLGLLFAELDRRADLANTIVVITADHGELFGEHGLLEHSNSLYYDLLHVPLIIVHPQKVPGNKRVQQRVSLRDLPETLIDLAGLSDTHAFPGRSLTRAWDAAGSAESTIVLSETDQAHAVYPDRYPARKGRMRGFISGDFHYIKNLGDGREELYDLATDPDELHDLAPERKDALQSYRDQLKRLIVPSAPARTPSGVAAVRPGK